MPSGIYKYRTGFHLSKQHRINLSLAQIGKKLSEQHKINIGLGNLGKKFSKETREKISKALIGLKRTPEQNEANRQRNLKNPQRYWLGKKRPEIGKKVSEGHKKHWDKIGRITTPERLRYLNKKNYPAYTVKPNAIYGRLKKYPVSFSKKEFAIWYNSQPKICSYCEITMEDSFKLQNKRLTIDRINNKKGYDLNNICLACFRCNAIKSDFFNKEEMGKIGHKFVKPKWQMQNRKTLQV